MAQSPPQASDDPQAQQHYAAQLALSVALADAVRTLWPSLLPLNPTNVRRLTDALSILLNAFSESAISLVSDHYTTVRRNSGVSSPFSVVRAPLPPRSTVATMVDEAITDRLEESLADFEAKILANVQSGIQKALADEARAQLVASVEGDENALGFARIARPDACAWCLTQAFRTSTRGVEVGRHYGVYKSRKSAGQLPEGAADLNRFHPNCHCTVEPIFDAAFQPAAHILDMEQLYKESTADSEKGERLNDFRRALAAQRGGRTTPLPEITTTTVSPPNAAAIQSLLDLIGEAMTQAA